MKTNEKTPAIEPPKRTRSRTGKIARLPLPLREQLNERLSDGEEAKSLAAWLNSLPEVQSIMATKFNGVPVREQNISEWRKGGYQDWRNQKETRGQLASFLESIEGLQKVAKDGLTEPLAFFLAASLAMELQRLQAVPEGEEKAKTLRQLTASLVALRRGDLQRERLRLEQAKQGLHKKTEQERKEEFWKWAEDNINRDEFCRRRCFTAAECDAAINKILGITPAERGETIPPADPPTQDPVPANPV